MVGKSVTIVASSLLVGFFISCILALVVGTTHTWIRSVPRNSNYWRLKDRENTLVEYSQRQRWGRRWITAGFTTRRPEHDAWEERPLPTWAEPPQAGERATITYAYGWPMPMLRGVDRLVRGKNSMSSLESSRFVFLGRGKDFGLGVQSLGNDPPPRAIPYWVYWPGAVVNAAVWGSAVVVIYAVYRGMRRLLGTRDRAMLCRCCGYNCAGLPSGASCPECGMAKTGASPSRDTRTAHE